MARKAHEDYLRRIAQRRGWTLTKSRIRDPHAIGYGLWQLTTPDTTHHNLTLTDVDRLLGRDSWT